MCVILVTTFGLVINFSYISKVQSAVLVFVCTDLILKYTVHTCYIFFNHSLLPISFNMYDVVLPSLLFNTFAFSVVFDAIIVCFNVLWAPSYVFNPYPANVENMVRS